VIEHRVFHRLSVRLPVRYTITTRQARVVSGEGSTVNLSVGGMLLKVPELPQVAFADLLEGLGSIDVAFACPPDQVEVEGRCRLVWMQKAIAPGEGLELGLRFVNLAPVMRDHLHALVGRLT
jgi:c-di-GMP-binding flagellar brake protein YcgR